MKTYESGTGNIRESLSAPLTRAGPGFPGFHCFTDARMTALLLLSILNH